jgi:hypothetical protein
MKIISLRDTVVLNKGLEAMVLVRWKEKTAVHEEKLHKRRKRRLDGKFYCR